MWCRRIIPCLDVKNGRTVKGTNFVSLRDAGDPVELAKRYYEEGADEIVFLDISASLEGRRTMVKVAEKVAREVFIPFTIGGGIRSVEDVQALLKAGADKVSLNSAPISNPKLIEEAAKEFGSQAIVVAIDAKQENKTKSGWQIYSKSGTAPTGLDVVDWAKEVVSLGAGEILLTSIDCDGTKKGFDLELTRIVADSVSVPVIASGGAGKMDDFVDVFKKTKAAAALAASLFHFKQVEIMALKRYLQKNGVDVRV
jgi:cyclase